jgi:hypothetical protein
MNAFARRDALAGLAALAVGLFVVWHSLDYRIGTPRRMGPGLFPLTLGALLVVFGLAAALQGLRAAGSGVAVRVRPMLAVCGALAVFGLTVERLGFIPAAVLLLFVTGLAESPPKWRALAILSLTLAPASWLLFVGLLGIPAPAFVLPDSLTAAR